MFVQLSCTSCLVGAEAQLPRERSRRSGTSWTLPLRYFWLEAPRSRTVGDQVHHAVMADGAGWTLAELVDELAAAGLPCGIADLDELTGGLDPV